MIHIIRSIFVIIALIMLTSCATQKNVKLSENFWNNPKQKIALATASVATKPQLYQHGYQGLLEIAISRAMNKQLNSHLMQTDLMWYQKLASNFAAKLNERGISTKIDTQLNVNEKNYSQIASRAGSDKVLVIQLEAIGAVRNYYGLIPINAPQAYCVLSGKLINTSNNQVLWSYQTKVIRPVEGKWDQPPHYPELDHAIKIAINTAEHELIDSFFSGH